MKRNHLLKPFLWLLAGLVIGGAISCRKTAPADLVLTNGKIITMEEGTPVVEALAASKGRIVAVGTVKKIGRYVGRSTRLVDLKGRTAVPGFIDSHAHFTGVGESRMILDLTKAKNWEEIVAQVAEAAAKSDPGEWIVGRGWHQEKWERRPEPNVDGLPFHDKLSAATPQNPVFLEHASGHSCLANAMAMELGGVTNKTPNPPGGEIVRDAKGNAIGAFRETAQGYIGLPRRSSQLKKSEAERAENEREAIELAAQECLSKGVTSVHDAGASFETIDLYRSLAEQGKLGVRIYAMISADKPELERRLSQYRIIGAGRDHLTVRAIKQLLDGALGAHGAWLLEPYSDLPGSTGLNTTPLEELKEIARLAIENDFQLCTHAIGDRANRELLDIYEQTFASHPEKRDVRWRVEHAQHLSAPDIPRFGRLGVIAAMQGVHCTSDGPWVIAKLGEQRAREGAYAWRSVMDGGGVVSNGTDAPVEDIDPIPSFYSTVTRMMNNGKAFYPEQRLSREEALRTYTLDGAYAAFQEDLLGSLKPGKLADITVLSKDIMTVPEDEIPAAAVLMTIVGGQILYEKD